MENARAQLAAWDSNRPPTNDRRELSIDLVPQRGSIAQPMDRRAGLASALLLICAAVFLRSALASSQFDPGLRTADTVLIDIDNEPKRAARIQAPGSRVNDHRIRRCQAAIARAAPRRLCRCRRGQDIGRLQGR